MQDLQFLSNTALDFLTLSSEANVYRYIGEKLREIVSELIVTVNSYDPASGSLVLRALVGLGKYNETLVHLLGRDPIGMSFKANDEEAMSNLLTGKLFKVPGGIHELTFGEIPPGIAHEVEKILGIDEIYGIGFSWGGRLYGSAMISSKPTSSLLKKKDTLEAFIHQSSMALQRKEAEDALRESEERYRSIVENSLDGIILLHSDDRILAANPQACRMHGYTEAEILRLCRDDIADTSDPRLLESIEKRVRTGRFTGEVTHIRKDGTKFPCEVSTVVFQKYGQNSRVAIFRDMTERKQEEAERERMASQVSESERRYHSLFESMSEGFVLFRVLRDETGHPRDFLYLEMNPAWERLAQISRNDAAGKLASEVLPEAVPWNIVLARNALGSRQPFRMERYSRWVGKWLEYRAYSPGEDLMAVLLTDISERKRAEEALRDARDELEMRVQRRTAELELKNKELQDFAFIASHDLKEPLRKIQAFGDLVMMRSRDSLARESIDYLVRMQDAAARMGHLLESLLAYSRVTTKGGTFSQVDVAEAARIALSNLEIRLRETGGHVELDDLPTLEGDLTQLVQLFQNLFSNSLKFRREAEVPLVRVHSRSFEDPWHGAGAVEIYVEDNGIGFDEKYLDKVFIPFQRLHGRNEYDGVGMGLAICKKIAERHGGTIDAKSTPGKGSIFVV
ncbi:MAG: hypothetical protein CVU64_19780, partial [Deltaproteobacteria bacterium HGW-Deltaproteobacteria-21]